MNTRLNKPETSRITLLGGKYAVLHENGLNLRAERYGEAWRDCNGDGLILALAQRIEELEDGIKRAIDVTKINNKNGVQIE